jgi:hypothetical protein
VKILEKLEKFLLFYFSFGVYFLCSFISSVFDILALVVFSLWCFSVCNLMWSAKSSLPKGVLMVHPHSGHVNVSVAALLMHSPPANMAELYVTLVESGCALI